MKLEKVDLRKKLVQNLPYLLIGLYATKLSQAWRLAAGNDASEKLLHYSAGLSEAFQSPLPSFAVHDLLFGAAVGLLLALVVLAVSSLLQFFGCNRRDTVMVISSVAVGIMIPYLVRTFPFTIK